MPEDDTHTNAGDLFSTVPDHYPPPPPGHLGTQLSTPSSSFSSIPRRGGSDVSHGSVPNQDFRLFGRDYEAPGERNSGYEARPRVSSPLHQEFAPLYASPTRYVASRSPTPDRRASIDSLPESASIEHQRSKRQRSPSVSSPPEIFTGLPRRPLRKRPSHLPVSLTNGDGASTVTGMPESSGSRSSSFSAPHRLHGRSSASEAPANGDQQPASDEEEESCGTATVDPKGGQSATEDSQHP